MSSSPVVDPVILKFCARVAEGGASVPDGIAGLLLRLAGRVASLEKAAQVQAQTIEKLALQPRIPMGSSENVEGRNGAAVGVETPAPSPPRPTGPKGRVDSPPPRSRQRTAIWSTATGITKLAQCPT